MSDVSLSIAASVAGSNEVKDLLATLARLQEQSLGRIDSSIKQLTGTIETLGSKRGTIKAVGEEADNASIGAGKLTAAMAAGQVIGQAFSQAISAVTSRVIESFRSFVELAEVIDRMSNVTGLSSEQFQTLNFAAGQSDVSARSLEVAMRNLNLTTLKAGASATVAAEALKALKIDPANFANLDSVEKIKQLADVFPRLASEEEKAAIAAALFGSKVGTQLLPLLNKGREELEKNERLFRELGLGINESAVPAVDALGKRFDVLKQVLSAKLFPNFAEAVPDLNEILGVVERLIGTAEKGSVLGEVFVGAVAAVKELALGIEALVGDFAELTGGAGAWLRELLSVRSIAGFIKTSFNEIRVLVALVADAFQAVYAALVTIGSALTTLFIQPLGDALSLLGRLSRAVGQTGIADSINAAGSSVDGLVKKMENYAAAQRSLVANTSRTIKSINDERESAAAQAFGATSGTAPGAKPKADVTTGFSGIKPKLNKEVDDLKSALALARAQLEGEFAKLAQGITESNTLIDEAFREGTISILTAFDQRALNLTIKFSAERALIEAELKNLSEALLKAKDSNQVNQIKTDEVKLKTKLEVDTAKYNEDLRKLKVLEAGEVRAQEQARIRIALDFDRLTGGVNVEALRGQLNETFRVELERAKTNGDGQTQKRIETIISATVQQSLFNEKVRELGVLRDKLAVEEQRIDLAAQQGLIGKFEAEARIKQAREAQIPAIQAQIDKLRELAAALPENATKALEDNAKKIQELQTAIDSARTPIVDLSTAAGVAIQNNLENPILNVLTRVQTIPQAFASTLQNVTSQLLSSQIRRLLTQLFEPDSSGAGGFARLFASLFGGGGNGVNTGAGDFSGVQLAEGGRVRGPGGPTSDSVPAMLSNEEFVVKADSSRAVGYSVLDFINRYGKLPSSGFKGGGLARAAASARLAGGGTASGGMELNVNLVNQSGTPLQSRKSVDARTGQLQIILEDMRTNGPIAQAMAGTFGINRVAR